MRPPGGLCKRWIIIYSCRRSSLLCLSFWLFLVDVNSAGFYKIDLHYVMIRCSFRRQNRVRPRHELVRRIGGSQYVVHACPVLACSLYTCMSLYIYDVRKTTVVDIIKVDSVGAYSGLWRRLRQIRILQQSPWRQCILCSLRTSSLGLLVLAYPSLGNTIYM